MLPLSDQNHFFFLFFFSPSKQIGEISSVLSLEDLGPIGTQQIVVAPQDSSNVSCMLLLGEINLSVMSFYLFVRYK